MSQDNADSNAKQERGILSEADREFLTGQRELSESAARNARQRIRDRVKAAFDDFELLWSTLPDRDFEQIFYPDEKEQRRTMRSRSQRAIAFIMLGLWTNLDPRPSRMEDAIEEAAFAAGYLADATLDIDLEKVPDGELLPAKMVHKEEKIQDLKDRIAEEDLDASREKELREQVEKEAMYQYYLFEKGLVDQSVDAEQFASVTILGEPLEFSIDEIRRNQEAWEQSPMVRKTMPTIVDQSIEAASKEAEGDGNMERE